MAVLEKIRVRFGLAISIIIALALLSFIIDPGTLQSAMQGMSSKYDVGKIAGRAVRYTDYQEEVERFTTINEVTTGSSAHSEQQQKQIRDAAWQSFIDKFLFVKNAKDAGITVGSAELVDLTTGSNPSPMIAQMFGGPDGYDPQVLVDFVQNQVPGDESGRLQTFWNYIQNSVSTQQYYAKYGALFTASAYLNALEKADLVAKNNATANVDYIAVSYPYQDDSTVVVKKSEIKKFYKDHKDFYEQKANRDIEYVVFEVTPSAEDIAAANEKVSAVYDEFGATSNMKAFLLRNSDRQLSNYWYKAGELNSINSEVNNYVFNTRSSAPSPIYTDADNTFYSVRVLDTANLPDSVYVKHILLQGSEAKATAEEVLAKLRKGEKFSALAAEYSTDKGSMADGELGNIGWMTQTYMIPGFEGVITAKLNDPYIVNTQYGTHVIVVTKRTKPIVKKQVAILEKAAIASKETFGKYYAQANRFASIAGQSYEGYKAAVDSMSIYSHPMNVNEGTSTYGSIDQAKEVTRWVFDAKKGKASNIITVNNNYFFVVAVKEIHKEGVKPLDEVAAGIRQRLYFEKLRDVKTAQVAEKVQGLETLEQMAEALGVSITNEPALSLSTTGRANDPALAGAAGAAVDGEVYGPIAGGMASYIVRVNSREAGSFFTEEDATMQAAQKAQYTTQMVLPVMSRIGEVKDNRERFF
ncbi:MAG: SurA N-terminal domain-containing protein [Bacteroidales bacterium]|nr:SurA N-terminal domain-containing protein [Bacteroidales bacterium]